MPLQKRQEEIVTPLRPPVNERAGETGVFSGPCEGIFPVARENSPLARKIFRHARKMFLPAYFFFPPAKKLFLLARRIFLPSNFPGKTGPLSRMAPLL